MSYRQLFIWVEGGDDKRFFKQIIEPKLQNKYNVVTIRCHAEMNDEKIDDFLKSIKAMGADYIFVVDIDRSLCVTAKKQEILDKYKNIDNKKIIVVIREIEGWYLAGLDEVNSMRLKIPAVTTTDTITKEQFNRLISGNESRINFMSEILRCFSLGTARQKNKSFRYCIEKYNCKVSDDAGDCP